MKPIQNKLIELANQLNVFNDYAKKVQQECNNQVEKMNNGIESLESLIISLKNNELNILVAGTFNTGKSTFINALLGKRLLPESVVPCTSVRTVIHSGEQRSVVLVHRKDTIEKMSIEKFLLEMQYSTQDEDEQRRSGHVERFENIDYAEMVDDIPLLPTGIQIMDTPGLDDKVPATLMTLAAWEKSSVIIYVCSNRGLSSNDRKVLNDNVSKGGKNLFVIINKCDQIVNNNDLSELKRKVYTDLKSIYQNEDGSVNDKLMQKRVFFLSSSNAFAGRTFRRFNPELGEWEKISIEESENLIIKSGFPPFEQVLSDFLSSTECIDALNSTCLMRIQAIQSATDDVLSWLDTSYAGSLRKIESEVRSINLKKGLLQNTINETHNKFTSFKVIFCEHIVSLYMNSLNSCGNTWDKDLPLLQNKVSLPFNNYTAILRAALNPFISKQERERKISVILKPFGEVIGDYLLEQIRNKISMNQEIVEKDIDRFEAEMQIQHGELKSDIYSSNSITTEILQQNLLSDETMDKIKGMITRDIVTTLLVGVAFGGIGLIVMGVINWSVNRKRDSRVEGILTAAKNSALSYIQSNINPTVSKLKSKYSNSIENFETRYIKNKAHELSLCNCKLVELMDQRKKIENDFQLKSASIKKTLSDIREFYI